MASNSQHSSVWDAVRPWQKPAALRLASRLTDSDGRISQNEPSIGVYPLHKCMVATSRLVTMQWNGLCRGDFETNLENADCSYLSCFIVSFWLCFPWNRSLPPSVFFFFFFNVYFKPFSLLFILLQPFCFRSCSDATAAQTPFPPADSVASLRRCGLGVLVVGRTRGGGGSARLPHQAHQPITCSQKELANRFYNGTLSHSTTNHSPRQTGLLYYSAVAWNPHVMHASRHKHTNIGTVNKEIHCLIDHSQYSTSAYATQSTGRHKHTRLPYTWFSSLLVKAQLPFLCCITLEMFRLCEFYVKLQSLETKINKKTGQKSCAMGCIFTSTWLK